MPKLNTQMGILWQIHRVNQSTRLQSQTFCQFPIPFTTRPPALIEEMLSFLQYQAIMPKTKNALIRSDWDKSLQQMKSLDKTTHAIKPSTPQDPKSNEHITGRWAGHWQRSLINFFKSSLKSNKLYKNVKKQKKNLKELRRADKLTMATTMRTELSWKEQKPQRQQQKHRTKRYYFRTSPWVISHQGAKELLVQIYLQVRIKS